MPLGGRGRPGGPVRDATQLHIGGPVREATQLHIGRPVREATQLRGVTLALTRARRAASSRDV